MIRLDYRRGSGELERPLRRLGAPVWKTTLDFADAGKGPLFEAIQLYLADDGGPDTYAGLGQQLGMAESAIKMAVMRLRESFRRRLRLEIAQTVVDPGDVDEELRHLFACLAS